MDTLFEIVTFLKNVLSWQNCDLPNAFRVLKWKMFPIVWSLYTKAWTHENNWKMAAKSKDQQAEVVACLHPFQKLSIFNIIKLHPALH